MPTVSAILDAYVNANVLLACAFVLWMLVRLFLDAAGLKRAFSTQLTLLNGLFLTVALGPIFVALYGGARQIGLIAPEVSVNLADFVLAQYLNGSFEMRPTEFEKLMSLRQTLTQTLTAPGSGVGQVIFGLLLAGHLALTIRFARNALRLRRLIRESYPWRRFGWLHIRLTDAAHVPFSTRGLRNHYIVIPSAMLSDKADLQMAMAHEFQHLRNGDVAWEIGLETLRLFFFWNPFFLLWKRKVDQLRELACDQQVLARRHFDVRAYSECLLRVCRNSLRKGNVAQIAMPSVAFVHSGAELLNAGPVGFLRYRVISLMLFSPPRHGRRSSYLLLLPLLAVTAIGSVAIQRQGDWSHDRLMLATIVNLERLDIRNNFGVRP